MKETLPADDPETKCPASNKTVNALCAWIQKQPRTVQKDIEVYARNKHGYWPDTSVLIHYLLEYADDPDPDHHLMALACLYSIFTQANPNRPFRGRERVPMRKNRFKEWITAKEAAALLDISRATFFRKAKQPRFRESLGFKGTNSRNGRYSLRLVLHSVIELYFHPKGSLTP